MFEQYQKARTQFVQTVADLAARTQNTETLQNAGECLKSILFLREVAAFVIYIYILHIFQIPSFT